ncbi:MAG: baseplate J/gp47 family protein [Clostridiales bacterium]|jgi:phage-related baseplate assembly protein|nr:baseplate J/gp47 family protein [Clostridiales bacterium]
MNRLSPPHEFVNTDPEAIEIALTSLYEEVTGDTVLPSSPVRLFISWVTDALAQILAMINHAANQNIPSQAVGENLDALGELYFGKKRPQATPASVTIQFTISEAQTSAVLIPKGTRIAVSNDDIVFATEADAYVPIGATALTVHAVCQTAGEAGNGYLPGQVNELVDPFPYFLSCTNVTTSDGGGDAATDDEYYALMVASQDAYSTAGAIGSYKYWAKSVSTNIADVVVTSPTAGEVKLYVLMNDGTIASSEVKTAVLAACNADEVRPLTDHVEVLDPTLASYNINLTYYLSRTATQSAAEIQAAVGLAVERYKAWQSSRLGRDINPSTLIGMLMEVDGVKRVNLTAPVFTVLSDGSDNTTPALASAGTETVTNGGYEDE